MRGIYLSVAVTASVLFLALAIRHQTHSHAGIVTKPASVMADHSKDTIDCYSKEYYTFVATDASKKTVDFIVDKMISDKFIIVNKDGMSYRFKLAKKYKTPVKK